MRGKLLRTRATRHRVPVCPEHTGVRALSADGAVGVLALRGAGIEGPLYLQLRDFMILLFV